MVRVEGERTLIATISSPGPAHVHAVFGTAFDSIDLLLRMNALTLSLPFDYFVRTTGKGHVNQNVIERYPVPDSSHALAKAIHRTLRLTCLTTRYADLWQQSLQLLPRNDSLATSDRRIAPLLVDRTEWSPGIALRSDFARRQALVEIDVLAAKALGMGLDELQTIYRIQFPVLQQYERDNLYDQHGRLVPTAITANGKGCVSLVALAGILREHAGFDISREYHPGAPDTEDLLRQNIRLARRDADILGISERCTIADLMATTDVRWSSPEHPQGRPVPLVGLRYTDPGLEPRKQRVYPTPWTRHSREADYAATWAAFALEAK
jgi:hypothetical protein